MIYVYYLQNDSKLVLIGLAINMIFVGSISAYFLLTLVTLFFTTVYFSIIQVIFRK